MRKTFHFLQFSFLREPFCWLLSTIFLIFLKSYFEVELLIGFVIVSGIVCLLLIENLLFKIVVFILIIMIYLYFSTSYSKSDLVALRSENKEICGIIRSNDYDKKTLKLTLITLNGHRVINDLLIGGVVNKEIKPLSRFCIRTNSQINRYSFFQTRIKVVDKDNLTIKSNVVAEVVSNLSKLLNSALDYYLNDQSRVFKAIVFGIQNDLESDEKKEFRNLGLSHILVASGANIILIISAIQQLVSRLNIKCQKSVQLVIITIYLLIVGVEGSLARAFLFFVINLLSQLSGREIGFLHKILFSLALFSFIFPELIIGFSFILSISAVLSLKFSSDFSDFMQYKSKHLRFFIQNICIVLIVGCITSYFFRSFNLTGIISNLMVLPLVEIIVVFGFWSGTIFVFAYVLKIEILSYLIQLLAFIVKFLTGLLDYISDLLSSQLTDKLIFDFKLNSNQLLILLTCLTVAWIFFNYKIYRRNRKISSEFKENEMTNTLI